MDVEYEMMQMDENFGLKDGCSGPLRGSFPVQSFVRSHSGTLLGKESRVKIWNGFCESGLVQQTLRAFFASSTVPATLVPKSQPVSKTPQSRMLR